MAEGDWIGFDDLSQPRDELIHGSRLQISGQFPDFAEQFVAADHATLGILNEVFQQVRSSFGVIRTDSPATGEPRAFQSSL